MSPGDSSWTGAGLTVSSCHAQHTGQVWALGSLQRSLRAQWILPLNFLHIIASSPVRAPNCSENKTISSTFHHSYRPMLFFFPLPSSPFLWFCVSLPFSFLYTSILRVTHNHSRVASLYSALSTLNYTLCTFHVAA